MSLSAGGGAALAAGISATAGVGQSIAGGAMNKRAAHEARRARAWQSSEREAAQDWQLDMWNKANEYNSPAEQLKRAQEAGVNPMAIINGDYSMSESQPMSAPSDPSGTMAQFRNPLDGAAASFNQAAHAILEWQQFDVAKEEAASRIYKNKSDAERAYEETQTIKQLRDGQIRLQGIEFDLKSSMKDLNDAQVQQIAKSLNEIDARIDNLRKMNEYYDVQIRFTDFQRVAAEKRLPKELQLITWQSLNQAAQRGESLQRSRDMYMSRDARLSIYNSQATSYGVQAQQDYKYYKEGYWRKDMKNRSASIQYGAEQAAGNTYSDFGYSVKRGMSLVNDVMQPMLDVYETLTLKSLSKKFQGYQPMMRSNVNPYQP